MTALEPLLVHLAANRFMPAPPQHLLNCGDGDYRAIGAEFLGHFVRRGGLLPDERVLDIGCGPGRIAVPLTQYLSAEGSYDGVDVVAESIGWCSERITAAYPRARFHRLDAAHAIYNPSGQHDLSATRLPFPDASFDFICMVSLLTHLDADGLAHYAGEAARLLAPGGRCFATAFLLNPPARDALRAGGGRWSFDPDDPGPVVPGDRAVPLAASAFDEDFLLAAFLRVGLRRKRPAAYGHWSGRQAVNFQDICIFERG
jgi:SAM-dependent methyltransferase